MPRTLIARRSWLAGVSGLALFTGRAICARPGRVVVIISANAEWREVRKYFPAAKISRSPFGEYFEIPIGRERVLFFHGGWGKISAAATAQHVIDRWKPAVLLNLGTCGGIAGRIERYVILLVEKTVVYDIVEMMGDSKEAIDFYSTAIDLKWLRGPLPEGVQRGHLVSADRDLAPGEIANLRDRYGAIAADWESGAIAWVASRNNTRVMILRGVTDLVNPAGGEAYGGTGVFEQGTAVVMKKLLDGLPVWLDWIRKSG